MDKQLQSMWEDINRDHFAGELELPADIDWGETSGENGIGAHGVYFDKVRAIAIDEKFKFDEEAVRERDKAEAAKVECAFRLMIHEMVHQLLHQRGDPKSGGHGASFLAEAIRISRKLGLEEPTAENARRWPFHSDSSGG